MSNKNKDRVIVGLITLFVVVTLFYIVFACIYGTYKLFADDTIYLDRQTQTKYIEHSNYIEVKGADGYTEYIGNNAELED